MPEIETRVCIDDTLGPYDAKLDPANRWNGWLSPRFTLDTVRKLAARTQEMADEYGNDCVDTIHVIDGGTDSEHEPRVVVLHIRWQWFDEGGKSATSIIQPAEGLYAIGGWEWTWHYATWSCACGSGAVWHEANCQGCGLPRPETAAGEASPDTVAPAADTTV
ncbi:hypothetical protein [Actinacidiphila soli]|uniref:hypothetical protein n=1 Tax=Actinacidiphila soli TaxID=2487275 RepID=UPI000FCC3CCA|nr:hypothetical protein [Actinacidiphila soli]